MKYSYRPSFSYSNPWQKSKHKFIKKNNKSPITIVRYLRYFKWRLLRLREHPHRLARGFAVGVFAGCLPLMGLQFAISIFLAFIFRGNKFSALAGTFISNPFTYVPLFLFNFQVGKFLIGLLADNHQLDFQWNSVDDWRNEGSEIAVTLLFGSVVVGLFSAIIAYYGLLYLLSRWRRQYKSTQHP